MYSRLVLPAPAKINRFLHITGRRADGYHNLQTLFQFLDYSDLLTFEASSELVLETSVPELDSPTNLIIRAAKLLQQVSGCNKGVKITLDKRLPMGGGVGGGSSDAATTLVALNVIWELGLDENELAALGLQLGADVPVFVRGRSAFAEGVGEQLTPMSPSEPWFLVLTPDVHVNTMAMYQHEDLTRDTQPIKVFAAIDQQGRNDFEPLVRRLYPEVEKSLNLLDNFGHSSTGPAMMSGSGACVFAPYASKEAAESVLAELGCKAKGFVACGINRSPLQSALSSYL
ncbi:4-(cytidine 5'-diphospho)-2-C-methyl-D-erythritol kinase [Endozoicomonas sp. Mp262]|uniref:4-(cytidine 5'-diphospho)-2-C-methyl-D-erythritol kinase n=1 Tax=Endozoicomonas sp. Mp262 TaxID=2919499 RepID=UPI0021E06319